MAQCMNCQSESPLISKALGLCGSCLRSEYEKFEEHIQNVHAQTRFRFHLPASPPQEPEGRLCQVCINLCRIPLGGVGYCGLRTGGRGEAAVSWYYDPLPTNCVADWVCPGGTGCGYPKFAYRKGAEYGYKNLAVFYHACSFNCLFCQNWHYRLPERRRQFVSASSLADAVDETTACICFFGGDPTPQLPHSIHAAKIALKQDPNRILRICWETNGTMNEALLREMLKIALLSGGCIKFDLKAFSEGVHKALTGITNRQTLENFRLAAQFIPKRPEPPLLVASTLLVPGYVDVEEVSAIASFIAEINPEIPYRLLAFHPQFYLSDLPTTSSKQAFRCRDAATIAGLKQVSIGNVHLLW